MVKNWKGLLAVEGRHGICDQWKENGKCSKGDKCIFPHGTNDHAQQTNPNAATHSEPSITRGRSVSRYHSSTAVQILIERFLHAFALWKLASSRMSVLQNRNGLQSCSRFMRLTNNRTTSRKRATLLKKKKRKWRQECSGYGDNCTTIGLSLARHGCVGFSTRHSPVETRCKKSWDQFEEYGSLSLRYVKQVREKTKDHRLEKYKSNFLVSEVPTPWNLRTGPKERLKDNSDAPKARHGILLETYTSSKRRIRLQSTRPLRNGYCKRDLNPIELESMRISRNPATVMTANGEVQTKEEATVYVKELDLFVTVMFLEETPAVLSLWKLFEDHGFS